MSEYKRGWSILELRGLLLSLLTMAMCCLTKTSELVSSVLLPVSISSLLPLVLSHTIYDIFFLHVLLGWSHCTARSFGLVLSYCTVISADPIILHIRLAGPIILHILVGWSHHIHPAFSISFLESSIYGLPLNRLYYQSWAGPSLKRQHGCPHPQRRAYRRQRRRLRSVCRFWL